MAVCALSSGQLSSIPALHSVLTSERLHSSSFQPSTVTDYTKRPIHTPVDSYHRSSFSTVVWDSPLYPEQRMPFYVSEAMPTYLSQLQIPKWPHDPVSATFICDLGPVLPMQRHVQYQREPFQTCSGIRYHLSISIQAHHQQRCCGA